jgi:hypothetical protein
LRKIEEAMADLEAVLADPDCFHSPGSRDPRPVQDYAISLASEFVDEYHDDLIPARLARLAEAEDVGSPKDARRHLTFVRRKVATRLREWRGDIAANRRSLSPTISQEPRKRRPWRMVPQSDYRLLFDGAWRVILPFGSQTTDPQDVAAARSATWLRSLGAMTIWRVLEMGQ